MSDTNEIDYIAALLKNMSGINVFENTRKRYIVEARALFVYILRDVHGLTYYQIRDYFRTKGKAFDHSTALHAYNNYPMYCKYNPKLNIWFETLLDTSNDSQAKKIQAKRLIDILSPSVAEIFTYMVRNAIK